MTQRVRVQNFGVSRDGIGAGEEQTLEQPFGHVDPGELMAWAFGTAHFPGRADPGGSRGLEDYLTRDFAHGIGAEIMGRHKFGLSATPGPRATTGSAGGAKNRRSTRPSSCSPITRGHP